MQRSKVRDLRRTSEVFSAVRLPLIALLVISACSKSDPPNPPKEASAPIVAAPSASASESAAAPLAAPSASATTSAAPQDPAAQSIDPEKVTALLVWQKDPKARGGYRTQWVERKDDKPHVADERPGMLFISSTSLWTLETTIVKGCLQNARDENGDVIAKDGVVQRVRLDMQMPEIVRMSDGVRVAPWKDGHGYPYTGTQCDPAIEDYGVNLSFEGGMGPFIVARMKTYVYGGGAHGFRGEEVLAIDLEKGGKVELLPRLEDRPALVNNVAKGLSADPKEVKSNGVLLMYGPNGSGLAVYRYWAPASYAGGSGGNSYSDDFEVSSKNLPPQVAGFGKLPAWAVSLLKPKAIPVFMIPPTRVELFKSQFEAAYAAGKRP